MPLCLHPIIVSYGDPLNGIQLSVALPGSPPQRGSLMCSSHLGLFFRPTTACCHDRHTTHQDSAVKDSPSITKLTQLIAVFHFCTNLYDSKCGL